MTRIVAIACKAHELTERLEASLAATADGARFVDPAKLPSEAAQHAIHAQLARVCREGRRWHYE